MKYDVVEGAWEERGWYSIAKRYFPLGGHNPGGRGGGYGRPRGLTKVYTKE